MKGKKTGSFSAVCCLISVAMVLLWVVCMACATWFQAVSYYQMLRTTQPKDREEQIYRNISGITAQYEDNRKDPEGKGFWASKMATAYMILFSNYSDYFILGDAHMHSDTGLLITDSKGETVVNSRDILVCDYVTEQTWNKGNGSPDGNAWIDLEKDPALKAALVPLRNKDGFLSFDYLRITGHFAGDELIPMRVEHGEYVGSGFQGVKEFVTVYEAETWSENETITVYAGHNEISLFDENSSVRYNGKQYQNSVELLKAVGKGKDQESIVELIEFKSMTMRVPNENGETETYTVLLAIAHYPLRAAAEKLTPVYIWTFALVMAMMMAVVFVIYSNLCQPLSKLEDGFFGMVRERRSWAEPERLAQRMEGMEGTVKERNDQLRKKENEISRLQQSVAFAQKAEENRRQMVSALAHELKTPLAIISGYTEGLQENIAEEKREQYLKTILSETGKMDALVMQMLELSRLEAGRVTLARDAFDLTVMIRDVFQKLEREAGQRGLQVELPENDGMIVYADEGRIEQVVRNLASNAVRYSREGGHVRVRTAFMPGYVEMRIYNDAEPFSREELEKVWEVFYRRDGARHGKGTGLGLAITKNIVQLHGGSCGVANAAKGVEFWIRIPQKY